MPEDAKEAIQRIDLSIKVNDEGMTLQDFLVSFLQSCDKHGLYACGVIVKKEDSRVAELFGMHEGSSDVIKELLSVKVLKQTLERLDKTVVLGETRISSQTN